jgi:hypothetical protein
MATPNHTPGSPELSVVPADAESPCSDLAAPFLVLEIRRGRTGYPTRPVYTESFLIGSGPGSDLRLGGEGIPIAHTLLTISENNILAQWLCESPPLVVNGKPVQETALCDGDQIEIGRFEFIVRRILNESPAEDADPPKSDKQPTDRMETAALFDLIAQARSEEPAADFCEMSAGELLELLEAEQNSVEHAEHAVRQAEAALLHAAWEHAENLIDESARLDSTLSPASSGDSEILDELERVIHQLSGFSSELELRARRIAAEEATQAEAAELLLDAQKELASQLERFHKQMSQSQEHPEPKLRKAA